MSDEAIGLGKAAPGKELRAGDVQWTWCLVHLVRTEQLWDGKRWWCLECFPEKRPGRTAGNG